MSSVREMENVPVIARKRDAKVHFPAFPFSGHFSICSIEQTIVGVVQSAELPTSVETPWREMQVVYGILDQSGPVTRWRARYYHSRFLNVPNAARRKKGEKPLMTQKRREFLIYSTRPRKPNAGSFYVENSLLQLRLTRVFAATEATDLKNKFQKYE